MPSLLRNIHVTLEMIKIEHTLFALPFAFLGAVLAANGIPTLRQMVWITLAMVAARSTAMAFNRIADREYDALNPRTTITIYPSVDGSPRKVFSDFAFYGDLRVHARTRVLSALLRVPARLQLTQSPRCTLLLTRWTSPSANVHNVATFSRPCARSGCDNLVRLHPVHGSSKDAR